VGDPRRRGEVPIGPSTASESTMMPRGGDLPPRGLELPGGAARSEARRVLAVRSRGLYTQALGSKETEILEKLRETAREGYRLSFGR